MNLKKITAVPVAAAVLLAFGAAAPAQAAPVAPATAQHQLVASEAFSIAAQDVTREDTAAPAAIPAVVATAFVSGAAAGAGKVVAGWAAKKVIGIWDTQETVLAETMLD